MCGRYSLSTPADLVSEVFGVEEELQLAPRYNIAPTQEAPIVRISGRTGRRAFRYARWGLIPYWAKDPAIGNRMINARCESAAEKPAFRDCVRRRRCLVPADGFYEWQSRRGLKQPYHLAVGDGLPFAFAGLYDRWRRSDEEWVESFTILTTDANSILEPIHDRMPVILARESYALWLDRAIEEPERLRELLRPYPADRMTATPVGPFVNDPRNDSPRCLSEELLPEDPHNLELF